MNRFIFDVDGTLTDSRTLMNPEFKLWFLDFIKDHKVWLVTGSDYPKTVEQLGSDITENVVTCYNCAGNETRFKGKVVNSKSFNISKKLNVIMESWLQASKFPLRTGTHIEIRRGMINFSVVGRGASKQQRQEYKNYDDANRERETIALQINSAIDGITASVAGDTGIDIYNTGCDKSQILQDLDSDDKLFFFGDKCEPGGNDHEISMAITKLNGKVYNVKDWDQTWAILKNLKVTGSI